MADPALKTSIAAGVYIVLKAYVHVQSRMKNALKIPIAARATA